MFALYNLLNCLVPVLPSWSVAWGSNVLIGLFAVLLIVAGARRRPTRAFVAAIAVFVGALFFRIAVTSYAKHVRSRYSVIGSVIAMTCGATSTNFAELSQMLQPRPKPTRMDSIVLPIIRSECPRMVRR